MKKHITTAVLYTIISAVLLGIIYPLFITVVARVTMPNQANGQLITRDGNLVGAKLIGQPFTGPRYFHSRPSAAGTGYDGSASSGSNLGPTSKALSERVAASIKSEGADSQVPVDLVTASGSGLDPDISPAAALYQVPRVAQQRHVSKAQLEQLVTQNVTPRQFGLLGEPRVNVLNLNLALDRLYVAR